LGHWVDFLEKVERPFTASDGNFQGDLYERLLSRFHSRPTREKEQYAHAYAEGIRQQLTALHVIPFDRQLDRARLVEEKLRLEDFLPSEAG
jgi:hypothetical protein